MKIMMRRLQQASREMSFAEGLVKLTFTMLLIVPLPILVLAMAGFWLGYYRFNMFPLLTAVGAILGALLSFLGVYYIIVYGHEKRRD